MAITNYPEYPMEQIEFLRKTYPTNGLKKTHELFNNKFGYHTESQVKHRILKFGIKSSHDGKFKKGMSSWNTGMNTAMERPDIYEQFISGKRYMFKKGHIPANTKPVGTEKIYRGVVLIKVAMPNKWEVKARYVYEQAHNCKLDKKDKILHLNGDWRDCNIENLIKVNDAIILKLNQQGFRFDNALLTKNAVLREQILEKIRKLEQ